MCSFNDKNHKTTEGVTWETVSNVFLFFSIFLSLEQILTIGELFTGKIITQITSEVY